MNEEIRFVVFSANHICCPGIQTGYWPWWGLVTSPMVEISYEASACTAPLTYCITMTPLIIVSCVNVYNVNVWRQNDVKVILCRRYISSLCHVGRLFGRLSVCHLCKVASQQISENILFPASSKYPILAPTGATPLTQAATIWDFHSTQCRNIFSKSLY